MNRQMLPYVVRQGDYLAKLAHVHGFDVDEVWNDPKNEALRLLRKDHHILAPGDIVYLPAAQRQGLPLVQGTVNRYAAKVPRVPVNLRFRGPEGPLASARFTVDGGAKPAEGTTDEEGRVKLLVPAHVAQVRVTFLEHGVAYDVRIGHLDPLLEASGVASRLAHLGFLPNADVSDLHAGVPGWESREARLQHAVQAFQRAHGLTPSGVVDEATREALAEAHGS